MNILLLLVLSLSGCPLEVSPQNPVQIRSENSLVLVASGREVIFTVQTVPDVLAITWTSPGGESLGLWTNGQSVLNQIAQYQDRVTLTGTQLRISASQISDAGNYTVTFYPASTSGLSVSSLSVALNVFDAVAGVSLDVPSGVIEEKNVSIQCNWTRGQKATVVWSKGGSVLSSNSHANISRGSLFISPVRREDAGEYTCTVSNPVSQQESVASLVVHSINQSPVQIRFENSPVLVASGREAIFTVQTASDILAITWTSPGGDSLGLWTNGQSVLNQIAQYQDRVTLTGTQLRISDSQFSDAGNYTVTVYPNSTSGLRVSSFSVALKVFDAVSGVRLYVPTGVVEERNVSLQCNWIEGEETTVAWRKGGSVLSSNSRINISEGSLFIHPVRREDAGDYTCIVTNPVSEKESTASLIVHTMLQNPVPINSEDSTVLAASGREVIFTVQTVPNIFAITWTSPGRDILGIWSNGQSVLNQIAQYQDRVTLTGTQLRIRASQISDAGNYTVTVYPTNTSGLGINSLSVELKVYDVLAGVHLDVPTGVIEETNVSLQCSWTEGQETTVDWSKGGSALFTHSHISISRGSLFISPVRREDAGEYTCTVNNPVSRQQSVASLVVHTMFLDPVHIQFEDSTVLVASGREAVFTLQLVPDILAIKWTSPGGDSLGLWSNSQSVQNQIAQYQDRVTVTATELRISASQISDAGNYTVTVYPASVSGFSISSLSVELKVFDVVAGVRLSGPVGVIEDKNVSLQCNWTKGLETTVTWKKGGSVLFSNSRVTIIEGSLFISPVRREDADEYTCIVSNPVSQQESTASLVVYSMLQNPVQIRSENSPVLVASGREVIFTVQTVPDILAITWTSPGGESLGLWTNGQSVLNQIAQYQDRVTLTGTQLRISASQISDAGNYTVTVYPASTSGLSVSSLSVVLKCLW
ncbi:hemicentin-1-like [Xyrauchen texanus]|uniref:hemicentin-1-like n=1 Tax=Xyrauchen texanus TaxID=154827 RepID=UPI002241A714|nr:hemicentin-1-like [Xyrauchen texanus]